MSGLIGSFYKGVTGLNASQNSLNATAHNIANVDTEGSTRQQVVMVDQRYTSIGPNNVTMNQIGLGTSIDAVRQVRDIFLDKEYRTSIGKQAFYEKKYTAINEIETIFGETQGVAFQNSLESLWTSIEEVAKEPDNLTNRATFVQNTNVFINRAQDIYKQMKEYQLNMNKQIQDSVVAINSIGNQIQELNLKIARAESSGIEHANDLRDARNLLMDELASYTKYTYDEEKNGVVTINIEGTDFIDGIRVKEMTTRKLSEGTNFLTVSWGKDGDEVYNLDANISTAAGTDVGGLKGLLITRGIKVGNYADIPNKSDYMITDDDGNQQLDEITYNDAVNEYNKHVESSPIVSMQAQFDQLIHGVVTTINNILCPNVTASELETKLSEKYEETFSIVGMSYTNSNGETITIDENTLVLDLAEAPIGLDENDTMGEELFSRSTTSRYSEADVITINGKEYYVKVYNEEKTRLNNTVTITDDEGNEIEKNQDDTGSMYTLGKLGINQELLDNYSKLALHEHDATGDYDDYVCNQLIDMWDNPFATLNPNVSNVSTFREYYNDLISNMAIEGEYAREITENQAGLVNDIDSGRQDAMGISSEEELTNIIKYQHAYNAAARYVNVADQMLEHIINKLGN